MALPSIHKFNRTIILGSLIVMTLSGIAVAQGSGNTFTMKEPSTLLDTFKQGAAGWTTFLFAYANRLFTLLLLIEFTYSAITNYLQHQELQGWMAAMLRKVISLGAFYVLLVMGPTWIPAIIDSLQVIGQNVGAGALAPDSIVGHGFNITLNMFSACQQKGLLTNPLLSILITICALIILFAYVSIAIQFIIAKVESYILVSAGTIFLGFGGSRWTSSYTERYIGGAVASGIKLMVLYLIIALGDPLANSWTTQANSVGSILNFNESIVTCFSIATGVLIFTVLCWTIPKLVSGLISGSPTLSGGDLVGTAVAGAGAAVGVAAVAAGGAGLLGGGGAAAAGAEGGGGALSASQAAGGATAFAPGPAAGAPGMSLSAAVQPPSLSGGSSFTGSSAPTSGAADMTTGSASESVPPPGPAGDAAPGSASASDGAAAPGEGSASGSPGQATPGQSSDKPQPKKSVSDFLSNVRHHIQQSTPPHDGGGGGGAPPNMNITHHE